MALLALDSIFNFTKNEKHIMFALLAVIGVFYIWELYLSLRQRKLVKKLKELPTSLDGIMTKEVYEKARAYSLDRNFHNNIQEFYSTIVTMMLIWFFAFYHYWQWSIKLVEAFGLNSSNEIITSIGFLLIMNTISTLLDLPLKVWNVFIVEEKHGFNKQTPRFFIRDQALKFLVMQLIGAILLAGLIWIVKNGGDYFILYVWIFAVIVVLFMMIIYPEVIAPLFDKYSPLPEGELKEKIEALAASLNYPLYKLYIVEGSKRSSHSNAYMYGFHKHKRIVLFDTLVKEYCQSNEKNSGKDIGCENDEVVAILAHELGHWSYSHTLKGFLLAQISFLMNFVSFAMLYKYQPIYNAFGFTDSQPILIGLIIVVSFILTPLNKIFGFFMTINSRRFEFQADEFARKLGYAPEIKRGLIKLHKDNLSYPLYDKLFSGWHLSHPPLLERIEALNKDD